MPLDGATCCLNHPIKTHKVRRVLSVELNTDEGLRTVRVRSVVSERQHRSWSYIICKCLKFAFVYNPLSGSQTRHSCCSLQTRKSGSHFSSPHEVSASHFKSQILQFSSFQRNWTSCQTFWDRNSVQVFHIPVQICWKCWDVKASRYLLAEDYTVQPCVYGQIQVLFAFLIVWFGTKTRSHRLSGPQLGIIIHETGDHLLD